MKSFQGGLSPERKQVQLTESKGLLVGGGGLCEEAMLSCTRDVKGQGGVPGRGAVGCAVTAAELGTLQEWWGIPQSGC